jgi:hypothetical protein
MTWSGKSSSQPLYAHKNKKTRRASGWLNPRQDNGQKRLSDDHFVPGDVSERRLTDQRRARTRLEEIQKERGSLKFWNVFKKAELDQEAAKLQYVLQSEELRAKMEARAREERRSIVTEKVRLDATLRSIPNLQPAIDRVHELKKELGVAFDALKGPEKKNMEREIDSGMTEWRQIQGRMENLVMESFLRLGIDWKRNLMHDHSISKQLEKKKPWDDSVTELESLLRKSIETSQTQNDPIKMQWAHTAADALAALRVLHGQTMRERKAPETSPGQIPIEKAGDFRASTDEELLALREINAAPRERVAPKDPPRSFEDSARDAVL